MPAEQSGPLIEPIAVQKRYDCTECIMLWMQNHMTVGSDIAFVALGSNLGDAEQNLLRAIEELRKLADGNLVRSGLWVSEPLDCPVGSPDFINAVVGFTPKSESSPELLLVQLQNMELELGRQTDQMPNSPRPLDLDIIAYGALRVNLADLVIPHPRAHQRLFVLKPLQEIAPHFILPGSTQTVTELVEKAAPMRIARLSDRSR